MRFNQIEYGFHLSVRFQTYFSKILANACRTKKELQQNVRNDYSYNILKKYKPFPYFCNLAHLGSASVLLTAPQAASSDPLSRVTLFYDFKKQQLVESF